VRIQTGVTMTAAILVAVTSGAILGEQAHADGAERAPSCVPAQPGRPGVLLDRVPELLSAQMAAVGDGGVVIAFKPFRGSSEFPHARFTVLALDASGCVRWRRSLTGFWSLAGPVQAGPGSIVVAANTPNDARGGDQLRVYTLSSATGRVLRRDAFSSATAKLDALRLVGDRRGNVAVVHPTSLRIGGSPVTVKLARRAGSTRWRRQVIARGNTQAPAVAARADGRMVVGYPSGGRFRVRTGTVAGRLGAPVDAGPVQRFQGSAIALGQDGTVAAAWHSPLHLHIAVRPRAAMRFSRPTRFAADDGGNLFDGKPAADIAPDGRVTVGFDVVDAANTRHLRCTSAGPGGRFTDPRRVADAAWPVGLIFGPGNVAATVTSTATADAVVAVGAGCRARAVAAPAPAVAPPLQAAIDSRARVWLLRQQRGSFGSRGPLLLTITPSIR